VRKRKAGAATPAHENHDAVKSTRPAPESKRHARACRCFDCLLDALEHEAAQLLEVIGAARTRRRGSVEFLALVLKLNCDSIGAFPRELFKEDGSRWPEVIRRRPKLPRVIRGGAETAP
jgi:hypothetical protein